MTLKDIKNIALIGMPAVGKSTVGKFLAKSINYDFIDTDDLIESGEDKRLEEIIDCVGLDEFLKTEEQYLIKLNCSDHVIATGGSVVYKKDAMEHLSKISHIIYLSIDLETLKTRLKDLRSRGVAISPGQNIHDLYNQRTELYEQYSDIIIECSTLKPSEVVNMILEKLVTLNNTKS